MVLDKGTTYVTIYSYRVEVLEYLDPNGRSPHAEWFDSLHAGAASLMATQIVILRGGGKKRGNNEIFDKPLLWWRDYKMRKRGRIHRATNA